MYEHRVACPLCRSRGSGAFGMDGWKKCRAVWKCTSTEQATPSIAQSPRLHID